MNNKYFAVICVLCCMTCFSFAQSNIRFFNGVGHPFAEYEDSVDATLDYQVEYSANALAEEDNVSIVAHSMGGTRALGLAGYLNRQPEGADSIDSIICIGSPTLGLSSLAQGTAVLMNEINKVADTLNLGWKSVEQLGSIAREAPETFLDGEGLPGLLESLGIKDFAMGSIAGSLERSDNAIAGMHPASDFIRKNIVDSRLGLVFIRISGYPTIIVETRMVEEWKLPANTKYGFVVGKQSNVLKMADDVVGDITLTDYHPAFVLLGEKQKPSELVGEAEMALAAARIRWEAEEVRMHVCAAVMFWKPSSARMHRRYASNAHHWGKAAQAALDWIEHYHSNYSRLLGTSKGENDCLIPVSDQYFDVAKFGGKYVNVDDKGLYMGDDEPFHHISELNHKDIWGTEEDSGLHKDYGKISGGILRYWLFPDEEDSYTGPVIR